MPVPDDKAAVIETLREYYAASNKHDGPAMVSYYSEPVMFITAEAVAAGQAQYLGAAADLQTPGGRAGGAEWAVQLEGAVLADQG